LLETVEKAIIAQNYQV